VFRATSLLGALYMELANHLVRSPKGRSCLVCGRWFVAARRDAKTCSVKCRSALSRHGKSHDDSSRKGSRP
jgi:hypothetical protein